MMFTAAQRFVPRSSLWRTVLQRHQGCLISLSSDPVSAASCSRRCLSSTTTTVVDEKRKDQPLPPNLKIDPRSSFAFPLPPEEIYVERQEEEEKGEAADDEENIEFDDEEDEFEYDDDIMGRRVVVPLPDRLHTNIYELTDSDAEIGTIWLDEYVFGKDPIRTDLLKRAVDYYRAKKRGRRKAKTKTISEVRGSGRKVRRQKGTGMARAGHSRPPHWRGGAKAHGPKNVTDYGNTKLNKKVRRLALAHAFSQKVKEGNFILVKDFALNSHKTKELAAILSSNWDIAGREGTTAYILDHQDEEEEENDAAVVVRGLPVNLVVASGNIYKIKVDNQLYANVYDMLKYEKLVISLSALKGIEARLGDM